MAAGKYVKIIWMYMVGLVLIFIGLYMIAFMSSGPVGFGLMMAGFFFSMIGGIYGKKKLMEAGWEKPEKPVPMESRQIDQIKQNVVSQLKPPETPETTVRAKEPEPKPVSQPSSQPRSEKVQEPGPLTEVKEKVLKIMVCPDCNTENSPKNMYCSNCGKRLRVALPKKHRRRAQRREAAPVPPGKVPVGKLPRPPKAIKKPKVRPQPKIGLR